MKYFNKEQIDRLKSAETHFSTVIKAQWKRGTTVEMNNIIADVYKEATGKDISRNWGCSTCVYNAYKEIGKLYFESVEHLKQVVEEPEPTQKINELGEVVANKVKRGRPKKA